MTNRVEGDGAVPTAVLHQYQQLVHAVKHDRASLIRCIELGDGRTVYTICGINELPDDEVELVAFAAILEDPDGTLVPAIASPL